MVHAWVRDCLRAPVIFHIRCGFGRSTDAEANGLEAVTLIECTSTLVCLVGMQLETCRSVTHRLVEQRQSEATALMRRIHVKPIEVTAIEGHIPDHDSRIDGNPDFAARRDDIPEHAARLDLRECLPGGQVAVLGNAGAMPDIGHGDQFVRSHPAYQRINLISTRHMPPSVENPADVCSDRLLICGERTTGCAA